MDPEPATAPRRRPTHEQPAQEREVRKTGYHRIMMSFPDVSRTDIALKTFKPHDRV